MVIKLILPIIIGYLIGSIPFGMVAGWLRGIDIRKVGSGNIGATNTFRALGILPAIIVFTLDLLKGTFAVYAANIILPSSPVILSREFYIIIAGIAAIIGHMYPFYLRGKGGKGSATGLGVLAGIAPDLFVITMIYTIAVIAVTRYVSVASITGVILLSALMFIFNKPIEYSVAAVIVAVLVIYKHIPNIKRLISRSEPKLWGSQK
ncbi:MAG: glycerol-3-phosphate 1-O-acyltransferase PlsY [bacterium]